MLLMVLVLQCGHGRSTVENQCRIVAALRAADASMWPRPFDRGKRTNPARSRRSGGSFNVATAVRPWKTMSTPFGKRGFFYASMWPRPFDRGKRPARTSPSTCPARRFNVATAVRPWKTALPTAAPVFETRGFNVATAVRPWKTILLANRPPPPPRLQCGHGRSTVENIPDNAAYFIHQELQCGHGRSTVENAAIRACLQCPGSRFNVATAVRPWKTTPSWTEIRARGGASMWPRPFDRGKPHHPTRASPPMQACFNVATAVRPWKTGASDPCRVYRTAASMWPRPFDRGKLQSV